MSTSPVRFDFYLEKIDAALLNQPEIRAPRSLFEPQQYTIDLGGKRIRPIMTLMAAGLCGGDPFRALDAAICIEMTHTFTLIHDDIMDVADSRRGKPTVFKKWGIPKAILAGDSLFVYAMTYINRYSNILSVNELSNMYDVFFKGVQEVCIGQAFDLEMAEKGVATSDEYKKMIDGKTSALLRTALEMGGISVSASENQLEHLKKVGTSLGLAFQIQDDLLDVNADFSKLGKTIGGDILEGKMTYLLTTLLEKADSEDQQKILAILKKETRNQEDISQIKAFFDFYNILSLTENIIDELYSQCVQELEYFRDSEFKQDLHHLIRFLRNRDY